MAFHRLCGNLQCMSTPGCTFIFFFPGKSPLTSWRVRLEVETGPHPTCLPQSLLCRGVTLMGVLGKVSQIGREQAGIRPPDPTETRSPTCLL